MERLPKVPLDQLVRQVDTPEEIDARVERLDANIEEKTTKEQEAQRPHDVSDVLERQVTI